MYQMSKVRQTCDSHWGWQEQGNVCVYGHEVIAFKWGSIECMVSGGVGVHVPNKSGWLEEERVTTYVKF